jgi:hypothetical protein
VEETSVSDPHDLVQHYWLFVIIIADVVIGLPSVFVHLGLHLWFGRID